MIISPAELLFILENYRYWIIFPIAIFEGPIIIIISGFLIHLGVLNGYIAYLILVVADLIGDSLYYSIGKYWKKTKWIKKVGRFVGYDEKSDEFLEEHFKKHKVKTFLIGKISHGLGGTIQIASGIAGVRYYEFFGLSLLGTIPKVFALILVGFYLGSYYERINGYLQNMAFIIIGSVSIVMFFVISKKLKRNFYNKNEEL